MRTVVLILLAYAALSVLVGLPLAHWIGNLEMTADVEPLTDAEIEQFFSKEDQP